MNDIVKSLDTVAQRLESMADEIELISEEVSNILSRPGPPPAPAPAPEPEPDVQSPDDILAKAALDEAAQKLGRAFGAGGWQARRAFAALQAVQREFGVNGLGQITEARDRLRAAEIIADKL